MLGFQWNALRVGDPVLVHDRTKRSSDLVPGTVTMVNMQRESNGVGIRIVGDDAGPVVVWPSPSVVHLDPRDPEEPCWRCESIVAAAAA